MDYIQHIFYALEFASKEIHPFTYRGNTIMQRTEIAMRRRVIQRLFHLGDTYALPIQSTVDIALQRSDTIIRDSVFIGDINIDTDRAGRYELQYLEAKFQCFDIHRCINFELINGAALRCAPDNLCNLPHRHLASQNQLAAT